MELADPHATSQECSQCGAVVRKTLSERVHWCTNCGLPADRDFNASLNILRRAGWGTAELENARRVGTSTVSTRTRQASATPFRGGNMPQESDICVHGRITVSVQFDEVMSFKQRQHLGAHRVIWMIGIEVCGRNHFPVYHQVVYVSRPRWCL